MKDRKTLATWLPIDMIPQVDARIKQGNFVSYSDYLRHLVRQDLEREAEK